MGVQPLGGEDALEEEMATHSSILAWKIPWTESMGSQSIRQDRVTVYTHNYPGQGRERGRVSANEWLLLTLRCLF